MKIRSIVGAAICMVCTLTGAAAPQLDLSGDMNSRVPAAKEEVNDYMSAEFSGFTFELPSGTIIQKGDQLMAKYPDGTFGVSMINVSKPSKQKFALELCKRNAAEMGLKNAFIDKAKFGKASGAIASGDLEGQKVTILVLPYDSNQMTTVIIATPDRTNWVKHFLETLKK